MIDATNDVIVCHDVEQLGAALAPHRDGRTAIAFVPTMGALHVGHRTLVQHAATLAPVVVVSIFVNPTQFDVASDLEGYPRDLDADVELLREVHTGAVIVYAPDVTDIYPHGAAVTLHVAGVTERLCGASRPGHFDGVATVVDALLRQVRPTVAVFGRKDFQQLVVVRRLVAEQGHDVTIVAAPTVRDSDGVATSSRNRHLTTAGRAQAQVIPRALAAAVLQVRRARSEGRPVAAAELLSLSSAVLAGGGEWAGDGRGAGVRDVVYLELVDPERIAPLPTTLDARAPALLAVAVHVDGRHGPVRLIDNVLLGDVEDEDRLLTAVGAG